MERKYNRGRDPGRGMSFACLALALFASSISVSIAVAVGWQRGAVNHEKYLLAGVGVVAVLGVHLLLALSRCAPVVARVAGFSLWLICAVFVAYMHAGYFLGAQDQAGARRAANAELASGTAPTEPRRGLSAVLEEVARVRGMLDALNRAACIDGCPTRKARDAFLTARIQALEEEADEVRNWRHAQDLLDARRDAVREDPVSTRLTAGLGLNKGLISLATGGMFSAILEGSGCLCWYLVFLRRDSGVTGAVTLRVTGISEAAEADDAPVVRPVSELDRLVTQITPEIEAGLVPCTVKAIRQRLGCGQSKASEVRRILCAGPLGRRVTGDQPSGRIPRPAPGTAVTDSALQTHNFSMLVHG